MSETDNIALQESFVTIGSELFRFQRVFEKAISKLEITEQSKYMSQFSWFSKNVIYPYARFTCDIAERVSPSSDAEKAVIDATDSAFILGMQLAMRRKE